MDRKDVLQVIVIKNGVEQFNIKDVKAAVINVVEDLPAEKKDQNNLLVYGTAKDVFEAQRELEKITQKNILKWLLHDIETMDEEDDPCNFESSSTMLSSSG